MTSQITFIDDIEDDFPKRKTLSQKPQQTSQVFQRVEQRPFTREEIEADYNEYQAYQAKMYQSSPQKQLQNHSQQSSQIYQQIPQNSHQQYQENKEDKNLSCSSCLNVSDHVKFCPVCSGLYKPNKTPFWIIIIILICIICFLGKRYVNF